MSFSLLTVLLDYDHYLSHQILPPIERLCEPIEGTDRARLAECLGMLIFACPMRKVPNANIYRIGSNALSHLHRWR